MILSPTADAVIAGLFGLLVGSFLNVVIHRLPRMLERSWWLSAGETLGDAASYQRVFGRPAPALLEAAHVQLASDAQTLGPYSLARPRSRCGRCGHGIRWYENLPVLSYVFLRGRCSACRAPIGLRYPLVELATGALFALCAWRWGISLQGVAWAGFASILVVQFAIDLDTQLLPDDLNYPLLWLGLLAAAIGWSGVPLASAVWGAALGYLALWSVYHLYRLATGKEGMGYGDFKLLAALGAWFGAEYLLAIVLVSSLVGAVLGGGLLLAGRLAHKDIPIAFGPFLAGAGLVCLAVGPAEVRALAPFAFPFFAG
ncbi:prepilin peptidase [Xylophilus sp.]|uniref:prepilin peptidase n=1 Tax=Xylophilus sp. TaxID=2653893 RepID=UPI0013BB3E9C|nr:A24 family peptidase [Xylophilus sp.]KAF1047926.1 MAG: Type 4 prepilin-like proteins leader peptide-processing enzyme [Xylophilus sp.]